MKIEFKWAMIFAVCHLLWMLMEKLIGLHDEFIGKHALYTNLFIVPTIVIYVLTLSDKKKNFYSNTMNYKQGFLAGVLITIIITLISPLTQYLVSTFISPEYFPNVIKYVVDNSIMTQEAAVKQFNLQNYIIQGMVGASILGLLITSLVAIFLMKKQNGKL